MSKKNQQHPNGLPTVDETLADMGLKVVPEGEPATADVPMPSWVADRQSVPLPPNLLEQLMIAHRERDAAAALAAKFEAQRDGLFTGFLFGLGLPLNMTYDLKTGLATVPETP